MREIRPYGSEGGGGETLPTPISSRWLRSPSDDTTGRQMRHKVLHPGRCASSFYPHLITGGVASLNHRLLALMPPASF